MLLSVGNGLQIRSASQYPALGFHPGAAPGEYLLHSFVVKR